MSPLAASSGAEKSLAPSAGPVLTDSHVYWGVQRNDDSLRVLRREFGGEARVVHRIPPPVGEHRERSFGGLSRGLVASTTWLAYVQYDGTTRGEDDVLVSTGSVRVFASANGEEFDRVLGRCAHSGYAALDAEGDQLAVALTESSCGGASVWLIRPGIEPFRIHEGGDGGTIHEVRVAGRHVAWTEAGVGGTANRIVVADSSTGEVLRRWRPRDFAGGGFFTSFDIDSAGNVAALSGPQPRCYYRCVTVRSLDGDLRRTLSKRASDTAVAIAGGRVAFLAVRRQKTANVAVVPIGDGRAERFGNFRGERQQLGEVALDERRVAWGVARSSDFAGPGDPGNVRTAKLDRTSAPPSR